jgi:hypothetical protein
MTSEQFVAAGGDDKDQEANWKMQFYKTVFTNHDLSFTKSTEI